MSESLNVERWTRAQVKAIRAEATFDKDVLRALVDLRMSAQENRKATGNQIGAIERRVDTSPDSFALRLLREDHETIEKKADKAIEAMVMTHRAGRWALSIPGIGATYAGVLLAYIEIRPWVCRARVRCSKANPCTPDCHEGYINTAGKVWRFAGLDPTAKWEKGKKRPHCAKLKTTAWLIGEQFKKAGERSDCLYAKLWRKRKAQEIERNEAGMFREQALARLELATKNRWSISPLQREIWGSGKLQPVGLDWRAGRYVAKIFLSHFHHVLHEVEMGTPPPMPYILGPGGHADYIPVPNWPID
jgi:hypothetical protein